MKEDEDGEERVERKRRREYSRGIGKKYRIDLG